MLAKIVQHNLWSVVRRSDLILNKAQFVYAIHLRLPFCLCKHILGVILEARDEGNTGLPFGCLLTQIILQSSINVTGEPKMKIQYPISKQTLMKSNAQLRRDDSDDEVPIPVGFPDMASSSQTVPPNNGGPGCHSGGDEHYAGFYVLHAAVHHHYATNRCTPLTSVWSRTSWTSRSASSIIILPVVMMRMMRLGMHPWQRMLEFSLFCCFFVV